MQDFNLKLFDNAYALKPKAEQQLLTLVHFSVVINLLLPLYLIYTNGFYVGLLIFLLDLLLVFCYAFYVWLNQRPTKRIHFTMTLEGVCYRSHVADREHEFEWEEVDTVLLQEQELVFTLKNGETHQLGLDKVQDEATLKQAKKKIRKMAKRKDFLVL